MERDQDKLMLKEKEEIIDRFNEKVIPRYKNDLFSCQTEVKLYKERTAMAYSWNNFCARYPYFFIYI